MFAPKGRCPWQIAMLILRNLELEIEELVLHGVAAGDRYRIGEATVDNE